MKRCSFRNGAVVARFACAAAFAALPAGRLLADGAVADVRAEEDRRVFAEALFSRGLYKQAAVEFERFLEDFPQSADAARAAFRLGEALRLSGDREAALHAYRKAAEIPGSEFRDKALFKRAAIFADLGRHEAADELFTALLAEKVSPEVRELALYYHATELEALGRGAEAEERLETLLRDYPKSEMASFARLSLARVCSAEGPSGERPSPERLEKARKLLRALADAPASPRLGAEALYLLAYAERAAGNEAAAAESFSLLFSRYPEDGRTAESRLAAAWTFCRAQRSREAMDAADAALAADPPPPPREAAELRYVRAQALFLLARYDEASAAFLEAADSPGADSALAARARYQNALSRFKTGDFAGARAAVERVLPDNALRADALWLRAEAASREASAPGAEAGAARAAGDVAIESLRRLSAEFPDRESDDDVLYRLGEALRARGALADAAAAFRSLLERHPASELAPQARFAAAAALSAEGKGGEALLEWQTYLRDWPRAAGVPEARYQAGVELLRLDRKTEALAAFTELAGTPGDNPRRADALFWRGVLLSGAGEHAAAETALKEALAAKPGERLSFDIRFALAGALVAQDKSDAAAAAYAELLREDGAAARFTPQQLAWLSAHQCEKGEFAAAAETARRMARGAAEGDAKTLQTAWTLVGRAERAAGRAHEAEEAFREAFGQPVLTEYAPEATLRLAELRLARGDAAGALPAFKLAVERCSAPELQPWRVWAYIGLGHAALALGDKDSAASYLSTVCLLYRDEKVLPPVFDETARLLDELGRPEEAAALRETKARDYPDAK